MMAAAIETNHLGKSFNLTGRILTVLKDISLTVQKGEFVALVGASGVGKSTLLHLLGTLDRPTSGTLLLDGIDPFSLPGNDFALFRNRHIGFVFQFHHLLSDCTALENTLMPGLIQRRPKKEIEAIAIRVLSEVGLSERMHHKPGELSGGEQQRVAIARALVLQPPLILADEPTGNLDTKTGREVFDLMRRLNKTRGITFVIATHNEHLAGLADRTVKVTDGTI